MRRSNRHTDKPVKRDSGGQFIKKCGSKIHSDHLNADTQLICLNSRKRITQQNFVRLINANVIDAETKYICKSCTEWVLDKTESTQKNNDQGENEADDPITNEANDSENEEEDGSDILTYIDLGKKLSEIIKPDITLLHKHQKLPDIESLTSHDPLSWLQDRPPELIHFLSHLSKIDLNTCSQNKCMLLCKIIELLYYIRNSKLILPCHFTESLMAYSLTNSKTYSNFTSSRGPGGSYHSLSLWLNSVASDPLLCPPGFVKNVFDNNQKIGKTYKITGDNKVPSIVMTSHLWVSFDKTNDIQNDAFYSRQNWKKCTPNDKDDICKNMTTSSESFRSTRNSFIESCLTILSREAINQGDIEDPDYKIDIDPYKSFPKSQGSPAIDSSVGEPDFFNPNSYETLTKLLNLIGFRAGIKQYGSGEREWLLVECDGVPYRIIRSIIQNVFRCHQCKECFYKMEAFEDHTCYVLKKCGEPTLEFNWVVPISGLLHWEMNAARAFIKKNWDVFVSEVGKQLGFVTQNAQNYLRNGSDHHKTWQLLEVLYVSFGLELLYPYVEESVRHQREVSSNGYWEWSSEIKDPNYSYIQETCLTYLHALMMLRSGVRCCSSGLINDAKCKLNCLFFSGNHPIYQLITTADAIDDIVMPVDLRELKWKYISGSKTGNPFKSQGGDAMLEEVNKDSKSWLKLSGIPKENHMLRIFRNLDKLNKFKATLMPDSKRSEEELKTRDNRTLVSRVRKFIRNSGYLLEPLAEKPHVSIVSKKLHASLFDFTSTAVNNIHEYVDKKLNNNDDEIKLQIVYTTEEEFEEANKIENLTKDTIKMKIHEVINEFSPSERKLYEESFTKNVKNKRKSVYINFYYEVVEELCKKDDEDIPDEYFAED